MNGFAYVADGQGGLQIIDVDPPESASIINTVFLPNSAPALSVIVAGDYAYVSAGADVHVIDISDPGSACLVHTVGTSGSGKVVISGEYAYTPGGPGLQVIDVHDPKSASVVATSDIPGGVSQAIALDNNFAFVTGPNGIGVVDVSNPLSPKTVDSINTTLPPTSLQVSNGYAFIGEHGSGNDCAFQILKLW
jgi:hypothetical protein